MLDAHLAVHASAVPGGGLGLFTTIDIPADTLVTLYTGTVLRTAAAAKVKERAYMMRLGPQVYVDGRDHPTMLGRYINDSGSISLYNVYFDKRPQDACAAVITLRDVSAGEGWRNLNHHASDAQCLAPSPDTGEELFVPYGKWYWMKHPPTKLLQPKDHTGEWPPRVDTAVLAAGHAAAIEAVEAELKGTGSALP